MSAAGTSPPNASTSSWKTWKNPGVVAPATPYDVKGLIKSAIADPDPVIFFEHKKTYRLIKGEVPEDAYTVPIGVADIKRPGSDITVVTYGMMLHYALEAAAQMQESAEVEVEVVDLRTIRPLDRETILQSVRKTGKVLIVHEDNLTGGIGGEIAALIAEHAFEYLDGPILRLAGPDIPAMPFASALEHAFLPSSERIVAKLHELAAY